MLTWFRRLTFFAVFMTLATAGVHATGPTLLFDPATGEVFSQNRAGEAWYPASLTKLMTSYIVFKRLRLGLLTLDRKIPVSAIANAQPRSKIGVPAGRTVSVDFALQALLVYSANDMAYVLAEAAGGSLENFVATMNDTAKRLGMTATHYVNPNGLFEPRQITTARDTALLASAILKEFPEYAYYFRQPSVAVGKRKLLNRNSLIRRMTEADGMKTGFICNSGFNLVGSATRDGNKLVAIVFGAQSGKARADLAQLLLVDGFARQRQGGPAKISDLANQKLGAAVPTDMTAGVCRKKPVVTLIPPGNLTGWGISLGSYETAQEADTALRGRLLGPSGLMAAGSAGIMKLPGGGFGAVIWNVAQARSVSACAGFRSEGVYCNVMMPESFAAIAALTSKPRPKANKPQAQGSDAAQLKTTPHAKRK
ncbi:MAG TPA: D-alanyl-D-alanine carboxypeptidase family protein [Aestuariivirga sp.]|nr:D-alanyl-D-alanine carboxypeptidase family protein [Aestuariivirga sp.]